jgi:iron-sulfur cluster insertion protein
MTHEPFAQMGGQHDPVDLTASAARRVAEILEGEAPGASLRIAVDGGGCSGYQYTYTIVEDRSADDVVLEREGAVVLIDPMSLEYLRGSKIDFVDDLMGQAFKIHNPQATASCGCGTSFAI